MLCQWNCLPPDKTCHGNLLLLHTELLQELADQYGFSFDILTADLDERSIGSRAGSPEQLVTMLAKAKADALMPQLEARPAQERPRFLITCDQVVVHKGRVLEKPESANEVSSELLPAWSNTGPDPDSLVS